MIIVPSNVGTLLPIYANGGSVQDVGGYRVHTFTSSGTFVLLSAAATVEYLVVGGGGGGGGYLGGGGGGGGFRTGTLSLSGGFYSVKVGQGGPGRADTTNGSNGDSSWFGSVIAAGGGGGGLAYDYAGSSGGSGGGAGGPNGGTASGGAGTDGQGYAGGSTVAAATNYGAAGGGGAGGVGGSVTGTGNGGNGGPGAASSISGTSVTYAGGGGGASYYSGGGSGGSGGGGQGGQGVSGPRLPTGGLANTGGGGGGGMTGQGTGTGADGGSGIVIVRYATAPTTTVTDKYWSNTIFLLKDIGSDYATNTSFVDSSPSKNVVTRYGTVTQGTAGPYRPGYWSSYWDGGSSLTVPTATFAAGTGDYTLEAWVHPKDLSTRTIYTDRSSTSVNGMLVQLIGGRLSVRAVIAASGAWNVDTSAGLGTTVDVHKWSHVAVTRQGATWRGFINGRLQWAATAGTGTITQQATATIGVDPGGGGSGNWWGWLSNLRISKARLYSDTFTPPTAPLTAVAGTSLLTCQSASTVTDASSNAFTVTRSGAAAANADTPFATGGSTYFAGAGDYLSIADNAALQMGSGDFTVETWWKPTTLASYQTLFDKGYTSSGGLLLQTGNGDGKVVVWLSGSAALTSSIAATVNVWNHIAVVRQRGVVTIYVNGVSGGAVSNSANLNNSSTATISAGGSYPIVGYLSNFRLLKGSAAYSGDFAVPTTPFGATSTTGLLCLQSPSWRRDNSPNNLTLTKTSTTYDYITPMSPFSYPVQRQTGKYGSTYFDRAAGISAGTGSYLTVADNAALRPGSGDFTIELWYDLLALDGGTYNFLWEKSYGANALSITSAANSQYPAVWGYNGSTPIITSSTPAPLNHWNHLAVTRSGSTLAMFLNGACVGAITDSTDYSGTSPLNIGGNSSFKPDVRISNARMVKGSALYTVPARTASQPSGIVTSGLVAYHDTNNTGSYSGSGSTWTNLGTGGATNNGTLTGPPSFNALDSGGVFNFTGTEYIAIPRPSSVQDDFSLACWFRTTSSAGSATNWFNGCALMSAEVGGVTVDFGLGIGAGKVMFGSGNPDISAISPGTYNDGKWHYAVGVRTKGPGYLFLFVDGARVAVVTTGSTASLTAPTNVYVGRNPGEANGFTGSIAATMMYSTTLSRDQVQANYFAMLPRFQQFTPPTEPLTAVAGTSLLTCQSASSATVDASSNNFTITKTSSVSAQEVSPFPRRSPAAGGAAYFDGSSYLTVPASSDFYFGSDFTIEAWVYPNAPSSGANITLFATGGAGAPDQFTFYVGYGNDGTMYFAGNALASSAYIPGNAWTHLAVSRVGSNIYGFVNGVLTSTAGYSSGVGSSTSAVRIGMRPDGANPLTGYLAGLRVVNGTGLYGKDNTLPFTPSTLPPTVVPGTVLLLNFDDAGAYDATGKNLVKTVGVVRASTTAAKYDGSSVYFDGNSGSYMDLVDPYTYANEFIFGTGDFTIEAWVNYSANSADRFIFDGRPAGTNGAYACLYSYGQALRWFVNSGHPILVNVTLNTGQWYHVAAARSNGVLRLFLDGVMVGSAADTVDYIYSPQVRIGADKDGNGRFNGYMSDFRVTKGVARYEGRFTPPTAALPSVPETFAPVLAKPVLRSGGALVRNGNENSDSFTLPSHQAGDIIVVVMETWGTTLVNKPAAGGTVPTWVTAATATTKAGVFYAVATASNHTSGTWTNTDGNYHNLHSHTFVVRGASSVGASAITSSTNGGSSWVVSCPTVTLTNTSGSSLLVHGMLALDYTNSDMVTAGVVAETATGAATGYTSRGVVSSAWIVGGLTAKDDTTGSVPAYGWGTISGAGAGGHAYTIEFK